MAAEPIVSTVAGNVIRRLRREAVERIGLLWGVNEEVAELQKAMLSIKALAVEAEKKLQDVRDKDRNRVRRWLKRLEDAVFDASDLVDEFSSYKAHRQMAAADGGTKATNQVCTAFLSTPLNSNKAAAAAFGRKIKTMNDRLVSIRDDGKFRLDENHTTGNAVAPTSVEDREKAAIIEHLLDPRINEDANNVSVFPIVDVSWKSDNRALSRLVFDDGKVVNHFDLRVCVDDISSVYSERELALRILQCAANRDFSDIVKIARGPRGFDEGMMDDFLDEEFSIIIKGKRYLLVLQDIDFLDYKIWNALKYLLSVDCAKGSKIIVAVDEMEQAADFMSQVESYIYKRSLDPKGSWDLFRNVVFIKNNNNDEQKESMDYMSNSKIVEIGKSIAERCGGNPYTIKTIGRMLVDNLDAEGNTDSPAAEKEIEYCFSNFLESLSKIPQQNINILLVLKLACYDIMPLPLKRCFFYYCRLFPKGFEIDVKSIVEIWMAQGFIDSDSASEGSMEEVGYKYAAKLMDRYIDASFYPKSGALAISAKCQLSDLMHELGILVSAGGTMLAMLNNEVDGEHRTDRRSTRYLSFHLDSNYADSSSKIPSSVVFQANSLRALIALPNQLDKATEEGLHQSICDQMISNCKLLHALDLHSSRMEMVPDSIGKLKHLRYLDVSGNPDMKALPNSITMLHCLVSLKLSSCYGLRELPRDIKKLISLKHLEIDWCYSLTHMPCGLEQMTQLETLSEFVTLGKKEGNIRNPCSLNELAKLNNLRGELKIKNLGKESEYSDKILEEKEHLRSLTLSWDSTNVAAAAAERQLECLRPNANVQELALVGYEGKMFCNWLSSLKNLVKFSLRKCKCQHLSPLSQLPSLKVLILDQMASLKYMISKDREAGLLESLQEIRLTELPNLEGWWGEENPTTTTGTTISSSMPSSFIRLERLVIEDCPMLCSMPLYMNLQRYLVLDNTSFDTFQHTINADYERKRVNSSTPPLCHLSSLCLIGIKKLDIAQCDSIKWERLGKLHFLRLDYLPKLDKLPEGLRHVSTLKQLHIWRCNIKTLPDWIGNFKKLERLGISVCPNLNSLPQGLQSLESLSTLEIVDCPILFQRCQRDIGLDWPKIQHIPKLLLH